MPRLPAYLSDFTGTFAAVNGPHQLTPSWGDLVRTAITTGYPNLAAATMPTTFHRTWAVLYRASIVLAYLASPGGDRLVRSQEYNRADRSEKGSISYYLGLFGAKYVAEAQLRTPWLWHYDVYHQLAQGVGPIARRPDLLGQTSTGEWIVIEAKGRTNGWTNELRTSAKSQARTVNEVVHPNGTIDPISANVASVTYFNQDGWNVIMDDPPTKPSPLRLTGPPSQLYGAYYAPLIDYLGAGLTAETVQSVFIEDVEFKAAYDSDLDLHVGVAAAIIESEGTDIDTARTVVSELVSRGAEGSSRLTQLGDENRSWSVGADGVIVRLGERWR